MCNASEKMKWIHLERCPSTQKYLLNLWENKAVGDADQAVLVSCDHQESGVGRGQNTWHHYDGGLACSLMLSPLNPVTLTSLEIGLNILRYFNQYGAHLQLKWPNDLFNLHGQKCGGILIHQLSANWLAVGIGLNISGTIPQSFSHYQSGNIFDHHPHPDHHQFVISPQSYKNFANWLQQHRLTADQVLEQWSSHCLHLDKQVQIESGNDRVTGIFKGIGPIGEALIDTAEGLRSVYSGSLTILPHP